MNAADTFNIESQLSSLIDQRTKWVAEAADSARQLTTAWPRLRMVLRLLRDPLLYLYMEDLQVTVKLQSMKDAEPIIESLQEAVGFEFDKTEDSAASGQREFRMTKFPLRLVVDVSSNDDSAACRRVVVGERLVPEYELRCDDAPPPVVAPSAVDGGAA